jgi:dTDP-4-dehydrorhamnose 3,5-epimerase
MEIENTYIEGLKLIHPNHFVDPRGSFLKIFNFDIFKENHLATDFKESYFSVSNKNVIRGMHFQIPPFDHTKIVYISQGEVLDVVLDIRKKSPTFGQYFQIRITADNPIIIYIPAGFAHGYLSKLDGTIVNYLQTSVYNKESDTGIKYDSFGMDWEVENPIVSKRDISFISFSDFNSDF